MFNIKTMGLIALFTSTISFAQVLDMQKIDKEMTNSCSQLKAQKDFTKRFEVIKRLLKVIEGETKKITDSNYEAEKERLFELNFYHGNLLSLDTPFAKTECSFQQEKLKTNFSDYKTGEIHQKLKTYANKLISIGNCLCE